MPTHQLQDPPWLTNAKSYLGVKEIHGAKHNPTIVGWWKAIKLSGITNDEVPWCASFTGACLEACGYRSTRSGAARSYATYGEKLNGPVYGCIVVFKRDGGGHVGFVVGQTKEGYLLVLGGNQSDEVNIKAFKKDRVIAYRWPDKEVSYMIGLPISTAELSMREA